MFDPSRVLTYSFKLKALLWGAAAFLALGLAVFFAGWGFGSASGAEAAAEKLRKVEAAHAAERERQLQEVTNLNNIYRWREVEHAREVSQIRAEFAAREATERAADAAVIADLRSGQRRLSIQVRHCETRAGEAGAASGGADGAARAELAPAAAEALWGIAGDGDEGIRQLTGLQAWAESAVKLCNGAPVDE